MIYNTKHDRTQNYYEFKYISDSVMLQKKFDDLRSKSLKHFDCHLQFEIKIYSYVYHKYIFELDTNYRFINMALLNQCQIVG